MIRIQKLLADWGIASRRAIEKLILENRITVNKETIKPGFSIDENNMPDIYIDGKKIEKKQHTTYEIYMFNKPKLVVSTIKDEKGRKCITDFLPAGKRLYPIGRLDYDSTGLLLVTNYGELTNKLLHPSHKVDKEYIVTISGAPLTADEEAIFTKGINLEDGITAPCKLHKMRSRNTYSVTIHEGRNRQVRRMFEYFNRKVIVLKRISFGPLKLGNLATGTIRQITPKEYEQLLKAAKL